MKFVGLYIFSFIVGGFGAWLLMKYGDRMGINDIPNQRSSHMKVIPKGGGGGVLLVLIIVSLILSIPIGFWLPALIIALISLWGGDKHRLSAKQRLLGQFGCSFVFLIFLGCTIEAGIFFVLWSLPLSIFIVGTSNFYNFMDGIDGIAGITGVVGFALLAFYAELAGTNEPYGILCIALAFSCLGFLWFNLPNARVFLGDIGSILLGFVFACLMIVLSENVLDLIVMSGFLATFYFDELFTMVIRIRNGDSLIKAHRKHIYQLLANELSVSHWKIALSYGVIQFIIGISLISLKSKGLLYLLLVYVIYGIVFIYFSIKIHKKAAIQ